MTDECREVGQSQPGNEDRQERVGADGGKGERRRRLESPRDAEDDEGLQAVDGRGHDRHGDLRPVARERDHGPAQRVEERGIRERVPVAVLHLQAQAVPVLVTREVAQERDGAVARQLPGEEAVDLDVRVVELRVQQEDEADGQRDERERSQGPADG